MSGDGAAGREVTITHPDRVLFPADGITKADLAAYHRIVAEHLVRHLADRPLMLQRFPEGIDGQGFYHKAVGPGIPDWVHRVEVRGLMVYVLGAPRIWSATCKNPRDSRARDLRH